MLVLAMEFSRDERAESRR